MRALLLSERAQALCPAFGDAAPSPRAIDSSTAVARLDSVLSWIARTDSKLGLTPERLPDPEQARDLEQAALGLTANGARLRIEPVVRNFKPPFPAAQLEPGWRETGLGSLGRTGEWFERYALPFDNGEIAQTLLGPLMDRVIVYEKQRLGQDRVTVVYDVIAGQVLAELSPAASDFARPVRLDRNHFAVPITIAAPRCRRAGASNDDCARATDAVELWQVDPPRQLVSWLPPPPNTVTSPEVVPTPVLSNSKGPRPRDNTGADQSNSGGYLVPRLTLDEQRFDFKSSEQKALQRIDALGHGLLALAWESALTVIDWVHGQILGTFPYLANYAQECKFCSDDSESKLSLGWFQCLANPGPETAIASSSGRFVAFPAGSAWLGIFDLQTGRLRVVTAPGLSEQGIGRFSPDERWFASGGYFGFGYLWNVASGRLERTLPSPFPWVRSGESTIPTFCDGFVHNGQQVLLGDRCQVATGKCLRWPTAPGNSGGGAQHATRADGTEVWVDNGGCVTHEMFASGNVRAHACPDDDYGDRRLYALSSDGEWLLRVNSYTKYPSGPNPAWSSPDLKGNWQLVSTHGSNLAAEWHGTLDDNFRFSPDGQFLFGDRGLVRSLSDGRVLWSERGFAPWGRARGVEPRGFLATPKVEASTIKFPSGIELDLERRSLRFGASEPKKIESNSTAWIDMPKLEQLEARRHVESQQRVDAGQYQAECDGAGFRILLKHGSDPPLERAGCLPILSLSADGSEVVLANGSELQLWEPKRQRERQLLRGEFQDRSIYNAALGPKHSLAVVARMKPGLARRPGNSEWLLLLVDPGTDKISWKLGVNGAPESITFGMAGGKRVIRALIGGHLIAWEMDSGNRLEDWEDVGTYAELRHGKLLALIRPHAAQLVQVSPPTKLFTLEERPRGLAAVVTAADGRFELIGDRQAMANDLRCRVGHRVLPFSACAERFEWPGR